jgi:HSP20 family molecular chaperone IbpA
MRYRRLRYRYAMVVQSVQAWPFGDIGPSERLRFLIAPRWRPDTDVYETPTAVEIVVDLAGVDEDDFEVQLFENVVVVEGHRHPPSSPEGALYHAAGIRQGPFSVEVPLPTAIDPERVEAACDRGLLRITLPKRREAR